MAMRWISEEWSACPEHVIGNCFVLFFKRSGTTETENGVQDVEKETLDSIARDATEHNVSFTRVGL